MKYRLSAILLLGLVVPLLAFSATNEKVSQQDRSASAYQLNGSKITVDGRLNENIWDEVPRQGEFLQRNPEDGAPASQETEFSVAYDDEYLYVGVHAFDDNPSEIISILTRRDESSPSDWVYISIDSYYDRRTAFEFGLNAAGVKQDLRRYDDDNADFDWEAVWEGAVAHDPQGWTAEFAIPFRELRFNSGAELTWGLNVYRELPRNDNELAIWSHWSHEETGFVSNYGTLTGLSGVQAKQPLYISPYILGQTGANDVSITESSAYESLGNIGADIRKSFDLGLTFSGTINPDFGQVEADPAEFNLTEFETYFREKRPFFMEGGNILNFSLGFGDGGQSSNSLFYSRRIGRAPRGGVIYEQDDVATVDTPDRTRILAAGKLTGKLENGLSIGLMSAQTAEERATVGYGDGSSSQNVIEPATSYFLTRIQQDYREGQTTLGGIFTATRRSLDDTGMEWMRENAYTTGIDFDHNFNDRTYLLSTALAYSFVQGSQESITRTQRHPARYFQRTDADYLSVDSNATSLSGYGGKLIFGKTGGKLNAFTGITATSPGFEVNDLGFIRSVDDIGQFIWVGYRHWEPNDLFLNYSVNLNQWASWTFGGERKSLGSNVNGNATLKNNWRIGGGLNRNIGGVATYHLRGGPSIQGPDNFNTWMYLASDGRKSVSASVSGNYFVNGDDVKSINLSPSLSWRPKKNISLSLGPNFRIMDDSWAWITSAADSIGGTHYIFSGMQQNQTSLTFRADVTLSTTLSLQYYTQAFLTAGDYHDFIEVDDHTAKDFDKRFSPIPDDIVSLDSYGALGGVDFDQDGTMDYVPTSYVYSDFNYKQLTSNLVLRWEYSTGSVMYLVWSRGASAYDPTWKYDPGEDLQSLINLDADNIFLLKINKLLNI